MRAALENKRNFDVGAKVGLDRDPLNAKAYPRFLPYTVGV
jgi:hypothetical protein